jgi:hypothetical protein
MWSHIRRALGSGEAVAMLVWLATYVEAHEAGAWQYGHDMTDGQGHGRT